MDIKSLSERLATILEDFPGMVKDEKVHIEQGADGLFHIMGNDSKYDYAYFLHKDGPRGADEYLKTKFPKERY